MVNPKNDRQVKSYWSGKKCKKKLFHLFLGRKFGHSPAFLRHGDHGPGLKAICDLKWTIKFPERKEYALPSGLTAASKGRHDTCA